MLRVLLRKALPATKQSLQVVYNFSSSIAHLLFQKFHNNFKSLTSEQLVNITSANALLQNALPRLKLSKTVNHF